MRKTAMIELRDKLLEEYQNLKEPSHNHEYLNGYREALKNVANDIDAQMLLVEKDSIVDSFAAGFGVENRIFTAVTKGQEFYDETFGKLS
jgi:hypothetical protein